MALNSFPARRLLKQFTKLAQDSTMSTSDAPKSTSAALRCVISSGEQADIDDAIAAEIVSLTLFDLGAQAVGDESTADEQVLVAGFSSVVEAEAACAGLMLQHESLISNTEIEEVATELWVDAQREGLETTSVGPWHIRAPWHPEPTAVSIDHDIVIDPGVAFGHGAHPSTRLALELMLRHVRPDNAANLRLTDLGTGTGVLAIIAARLGAQVYAVESDADAIDVARYNIDRNRPYPNDEQSDRITLIHEDAAQVGVDNADLVVANVTLDIHRLLAPTCASVETLIVSGILCRQVREMYDIYPQLWPSTILTNGEWAAIEFLSVTDLRRKKP